MKLNDLHEDYRSGPYNFPYDACTRSQAKYGPMDYFPHKDAPPAYKHRRKKKSSKSVKESKDLSEQDPQAQLVLLQHHVKDALEALNSDNKEVLKASLVDIDEIVGELASTLPKN